MRGNKHLWIAIVFSQVLFLPLAFWYCTSLKEDEVGDSPWQRGAGHAQGHTETDQGVINGTKVIRVLTYNILMLPSGGSGKQNLYKEERLMEWSADPNGLAAFDVVALQEMYSFLPQRIKTLTLAAENLGFQDRVFSVTSTTLGGRSTSYHHATVRSKARMDNGTLGEASKAVGKSLLPESPSSIWQELFRFLRLVFSASTWTRMVLDGGVVILSRFPIVEHSHLVFRNAGEYPDSLTVLQAIHALIEIPFTGGSKFHFFATHLQSSYADLADNSKHDLARSAQMLELRGWIRSIMRLHDYRYPAVVAGDLNVDARIHRRRLGLTDRHGTLIDDEEDEAPGAESEEYHDMMERFDLTTPIGERLKGTVLEELIKDLDSWDLDGKDEHERKKIRPARDLLKETHGGRHPVTVGDVEVCQLVKLDNTNVTTGALEWRKAPGAGKISTVHPSLLEFSPKESALTEQPDYFGQNRKDYILFIDSQQNCQPSIHGSCIQAEERASRVEFFFTNDTEQKRPYSQLSDHYGVSTRLYAVPRQDGLPNSFS